MNFDKPNLRLHLMLWSKTGKDEEVAEMQVKLD